MNSPQLLFIGLLVFVLQLNIQQHSLVLLHMNPPAAVLAFAVPLGPVRGQNHAPRSGQVPPTLGCRERVQIEELGPQQSQQKHNRAPASPLQMGSVSFQYGSRALMHSITGGPCSREWPGSQVNWMTAPTPYRGSVVVKFPFCRYGS